MTKLWNYISMALSGLAGFLFIFSICSLDSKGWWPVVLLVISGICLFAIAWHKGWIDGVEAEDAE